MDSQNLRRPIEGASAREEIFYDTDENSRIKEKIMSFTPYFEEVQKFLKDLNLEELVFIKLQNIIENLNENTQRNFLKIVLSEVEKPLFKLILEKTRGNQSKAAAILGCNRNTLHRKLKEFSIEPRQLRRTLKAPKHPSPTTTCLSNTTEEPPSLEMRP
jgi:DNA-binding protein Fis